MGLSDSQIIAKLKSILDYLSLNSPGTDLLRWIGWSIIKGLSAVDNSLSNGVTQAYKLMAFYDSSGFNAFIKPYLPFFFTMAGLALAYLGWTIIIRHRTDYNKLIVNFLVIVTFFAAMPWGMQQMYKMVNYGQSGLSSAKSLSSQMGDGTQVIKSNITDLYLLDKAKFNASKMSSKNYISSDSDVSVLDINEAVDTGNNSPLSDDGKKIFSKKLSNSTGKLTLEDMQTHWFTADEAYYRYSWHPFLMIISLLMTMVVVLSTMFKVAQLSMELALVKTIAIGSSFTDLESGQRTKKMILKIRNIFIVLYLMALTLKIYFVFLDYISSVKGISDLVRVIFTVAAGFLVIDGPNIVEELFGINAGMSSAIKGAMGLMGAGFLASRAAGGALDAGKKALDVGKKMAGRAANVGGAALGAGKGALDGFKSKATNAADPSKSKNVKPDAQPGNSKQPGGLGEMKAPLSDEAAAQKMGDKIATASKGLGFSTPGAGGTSAGPSVAAATKPSAAVAGNQLATAASQSTPAFGNSDQGGAAIPDSSGSIGGTSTAALGDASAGGGPETLGSSGPHSSGAFSGFGHFSPQPISTVRGTGQVHLPASVAQRAAAGKQAIAATEPQPTTRETLGQAAGRKLTNSYAGMAQRISDSAPFSAYRKSRDLTYNSIAGPPPASIPTQADSGPNSPPSGPTSLPTPSISSSSQPSHPVLSTTSANPSTAATSSPQPIAAPPVPQALHAYSKANQASIREQFPNAQAVGSASFWHSHGAAIQSGAQPITVTVPVKDGAGKVTDFQQGEVYDISQTTMNASNIPGWLSKNVKKGVKQ
ncbi:MULTISPECIES: pLS20_p028 family conjugation system transmembrane protein [unclassified Sporolactobacillus]|uniref:pLS20_p028 family conjugation system transmembrane protein n=1 Tax=unclassified Sporolactobacillus TaxID=2628533 RepID=UPI0023686F39|nr:hypothetical protein [Sporolactobacillus sp. CQH2019]MDD9150447.1 hypothetical protein [Sporolactobacillus sp. CQH2019]